MSFVLCGETFLWPLDVDMVHLLKALVRSATPPEPHGSSESTVSSDVKEKEQNQSTYRLMIDGKAADFARDYQRSASKCRVWSAGR